MHKVMRSRWWKPLLLLSLVLFVAQCGDESDVVMEDPECFVEGFEGGEYAFTVDVDRIDDLCAAGFFNGYIDPGPWGPFPLPAVADPPQDITITLPFVGAVTGTVSWSGSTIRFVVLQPVQISGIPVPGYGAVSVTARVSASFCPASQERVDGELTITIQELQPAIPLINPPCQVTVPGIGSLQG